MCGYHPSGHSLRCACIVVGSIKGRRGLTIGTTTVIVVLVFGANGLVPHVEQMAWTQPEASGAL